MTDDLASLDATAQAELGRVRATAAHEAGLTKAADEVVRVVRPVVVVLQETHALVVGLAFDGAHEILEQRRDATERPVGNRLRCLIARLVEARVDDGVQLGVELLDAVDRGVDELHR